MRFITRTLGALAAVAAFALAPAPAVAQDGIISVDVNIGTSNHSHRYRTPRPGSQDWAEHQFIFNSRSIIRRDILPTAAEYGEEGEWIADDLIIPGITRFQNGRRMNYMTQVGRYDVNVDIRVRDRQRSARQNIVELEVRMEMYGPNLRRRGETTTVTVIGVQTRPGQWSFYPRNGYRGYRR